jgi:Tfp pilus assembly protein PilF
MRPSLLVITAVLTGLFVSGCVHVPDEHERQGAQIHFDLGVQAQMNGDPQGAYREFRSASQLDPDMPEAHNALGLLLHVAFHKPEEAIAQYRQALELRPSFSEAQVNLANVYLSEERYDEAIARYEIALNDMLYATPFIAQSNMGWALFKKGDISKALQNIKAAVLTNPKFCQGYRNLALIYESEKNDRLACDQWQKFGETCPDQAEPQYKTAMCLLRQGDVAGAKKGFTGCVDKVQDPTIKEDCRTQLDQLGGREQTP